MPLNGISTLPGLGTTAKNVIAAYTASLKSDVFMQEYSRLGLRPLWNMAFPPYHYVATNGPGKTADGFKVKVIRASGGPHALALQALGAQPITLGPVTVYSAIQLAQGTTPISQNGKKA